MASCPLPGEWHGAVAGIRRVRAYLPRPVQGKSDCPVSETIRQLVPDRPESLPLERGGRHRRVAQQGSGGLRREMESQGAFRRHVFWSILGRRHQTRETRTSQTSCRSQAGRSGWRCGTQRTLKCPTSVRFGPYSRRSFPASDGQIQFIGTVTETFSSPLRPNRPLQTMSMRVGEEAQD